MRQPVIHSHPEQTATEPGQAFFSLHMNRWSVVLLGETIRALCMLLLILAPAVVVCWMTAAYPEEIAAWHLKRASAPILYWVGAGLLHFGLAVSLPWLIYPRRHRLRIVAAISAPIAAAIIDIAVSIAWWLLLFMAYPHGMR